MLWNCKRKSRACFCLILEFLDITVEQFKIVLALLDYAAGIHFYELFVRFSYQFAEHGFHKKVSEGLYEKIVNVEDKNEMSKDKKIYYLFRKTYPKNIDFGPEPIDASDIRYRIFK